MCDAAFVVRELDRKTGTIVLEIKKGIIGPVANQLKNTSDKRKGASIVRKLGCILSQSGDFLYGEEGEESPDFVAPK